MTKATLSGELQFYDIAHKNTIRYSMDKHNELGIKAVIMTSKPKPSMSRSQTFSLTNANLHW